MHLSTQTDARAFAQCDVACTLRIAMDHAGRNQCAHGWYCQRGPGDAADGKSAHPLGGNRYRKRPTRLQPRRLPFNVESGDRMPLRVWGSRL